MSLYNMIHGVNPFAGLLMQMIGNPNVPRFRDCYLDEKGRIAIYTRTGGGNRDFYEHADRCRENYPEYFNGDDNDPSGPWNSDLRKIAGFVYDEDDDFDCTYATFYFEVPEAFKPMVQTLADLGAKKIEKPNEAWLRVLSDLKAGARTAETDRALEGMKPILDQISEALASQP